MANCKGLAVNMRLQWAQAVHGDDGLRRLIEGLTPESRALVEARILPHAWVPLALFNDVNVTADRLFGAGDLKLCVALGAWAAEKSLPTLFRIFYRFGTPMFIFGKAAKLWSAHYDTGRLEPLNPGPNEVRLRLRDHALPHRAHCLSVLGWATRSVEMSGGNITCSEEVQCRTTGAPWCELKITWA